MAMPSLVLPVRTASVEFELRSNKDWVLKASTMSISLSALTSSVETIKVQVPFLFLAATGAPAKVTVMGSMLLET